MIEVPGYKIQRELGKGGMATVYLAVQESLNRLVALKILNRFDTKAQTERFFNEGKIIASLNHHNIITIHDLGEVNGHCFLAMEYLEGGDLRQYLNQGLKEEQSTELLKVIANCLAFVHEKEIVHRDIKPENILFRSDGTLVLTDFGVAKQLQTDPLLTMDGMVVGSPFYISPEQAEHKPLSAKTDIYSLGIVFYEMLTGQKPFQGSSPIKIIIAHLTTEAAPLPKHLEQYQALIDLMIAKDAEDRFKSATDLIAFLEKAMKPLSPYELTKHIGAVVSVKGKNSIKHSLDKVTQPLPSYQSIKQTGSALSLKGRSIKRSLSKVTKPLTLHQFIRYAGIVVAEKGKSIKHSLDETAQDLPSYKDIKQIGIELLAKGKSMAHSVALFLPIKKYTANIGIQGKWLWAGSAAVAIVSLGIYFFTTPIKPASVATIDTKPAVSENASKIKVKPAIDAKLAASESAGKIETKPTVSEITTAEEPDKANELNINADQISNKAIQQLLAQAQSILDERNLTLAKLRHAHDAYKRVLDKDPANPDALQGLKHIAGLDLRIQDNIETKLEAANNALKQYRLTSPKNNNAWHYFQQVLLLNPGNKAARRGKTKVINAYAALAERNQQVPDYSKAAANIKKGLRLAPNSARLLALRDLNIKLLAANALHALKSKPRNQVNISANLTAGEKALTSFRLTVPRGNNALYYFQEVLRLDPGNLKAKQGKLRIADAYADLAEINLNAFKYDKAKSNIGKGLAINPDSVRLLKLKKETNMFIDAPQRVFKKFISVFN